MYYCKFCFEKMIKPLRDGTWYECPRCIIPNTKNISFGIEHIREFSMYYAEPVYDEFNAEEFLIPQGDKVYGMFNNYYGDKRTAIYIYRLENNKLMDHYPWIYLPLVELEITNPKTLANKIKTMMVFS